MSISIKALRHFVVAAKAGSIAAASEKVNVVPSAVLASIKQVEEAFGLRLTVRSRSKGMSLNSTGQIILPRIQHLLDEYQALLSHGAEMRTQLVGTLRIGYYAPVAPAFLPVIAGELIDQNPRVEVKLTECDTQRAQQGLMSGEFDLILCVAESWELGLAYTTLIEMPPYLLLPRDHSRASVETVDLGDLGDERFVLLDQPVISEYYGRLFEAANIAPQIACTATSLEMVRSLVGAGIGCSLLHMQPHTGLTYGGTRVLAKPLRPAGKPLKIVLGYLPENPRRLIKHCAEQLRTYFKTEQALDLLVREFA